MSALGKKDKQSNTSIILIQEGVEIRSIRDLSGVIPSAVHDEVHITPSFIEFKEASEGITCRQRLIIKNTGTKPAFIRLRQPHSIIFHVKLLKSGVMLNPGLSVVTSVIYSFRRPSFLRAMIPIEVNGKVLDYRVESKLLEEGISIEPKSIDFGVIDVGYSSGIKEITVKNEGGKSTRFSIDLGQNDLEISVKPLRGVVRPNKPLKLTVELIGIKEGVFYSEFWIKSVPNIRVPLKVNVIAPRLAVYHPNTTGDFTLLDFSITIANTRKYQTFVLRNLSSQVASYVVLAEIENEVQCIKDIDRVKYPVYNAFEIRPIQGRMDAMEGIIFEVGFIPTTKLFRWRQQVKEKPDSPENDFVAFFRIVRVHVTESKNIPRSDAIEETADYDEEPGSHELSDNLTDINDSSSVSSSSSSERNENDIIRLCLHGEVEEASLKFEPDIVYFGDLKVGETSQRVIRVLNPLKYVPIVYRFVHNAAVHCYPESMELKPEGSIEVLLKLTAAENVDPSFKIYFDAVADSCELTQTRNRIQLKVATYSVDCVASVSLITKNRTGSCDHSKKIRKPPLSDILPVNKVRRRKEVPKDPNTEVVNRIVRLPKWKYKELSETVKCSTVSKTEGSTLEINTEVLIPLSPLQIYSVHMYPSMFTFGMVVLKSHSYRQLVVQNMNDFPVMIRLMSFSSKCIKFPEGNLVILPAGALVSRLIEFQAYHIGKYNGYIDYIINDNHSFEIGVTADIVQKQLSLEDREVVLGTEWLKEEVYQPLDVPLRIINKLEAKTSFKWDVPATCGFSVQPVSGVVRGNSSLFSYAYYNPNVTRSHSAELTMKCESGSYVTTRLSIQLAAPKVSFVEDNISVGEIPLNLATKVIALLNNSDYVEVVYEVDSSSLIHGCSVHPLQGVITPRGIVALEVILTLSYCFELDTAIQVTVQGCLTLQLRIKGNVTFPQLKLFPPSISLSRINAAAYRQNLITATNAGTTLLKLNFMLQDYPEFRLSLSPDRQHPGIENEDVLIQPGASQTLHLHFEPTDLASYAFYLPIVINDMIGPAVTTEPKSLKPAEYLKRYKKYYTTVKQNGQNIPSKLVTIPVDCTIAGHVVHFNKLQFHFNVLEKTVDQFCIENRKSLEKKSIRIDISSFLVMNCPFSIQWAGGNEATVTTQYIECRLQQGEKCVFMLEFHPLFPGNFDLEAPIIIDNEVDNTIFNVITLIGEYPVRSIEAELSEIYFSPVPLDTSIDKTFRLYAKNFEEDSTISATVLTKPECASGLFQQDTLYIHFLDKNSVSAFQYTELEVKIMFKSDIPVSFRVTVEFTDNTGLAVCPVTVYATADNSLLTTYTYLRKSLSLYDMSVDQDKRASYDVKLSDTPSYEEEYDDDQHSNRQRQPSAPRISILSYIERYSEGSIKKLLESRFKVPTVEKPIHTNEMNEFDNLRKPEDGSMNSSKVSQHPVKKQFHQVEFPRFPSGIENNNYDIHMKQTLKAAEEWLYSGPFNFAFYPDIPIGITMTTSKFYPPKQVQPKGKGRKSSAFEWSLLGVLESLLGSQIYEFLEKPKPLPTDDFERAIYLYESFDSILNFLREHGARICHISAQFLLNYDDYVIISKHLKSTRKSRRISVSEHTNADVLSPRSFEARSKQCWLDVILQMYKCFVLTPISQVKVKKESIAFTASTPRRSTIHRASVITASLFSLPKQYESRQSIRTKINPSSNCKANNCNYSEQEMLLMSWLEYHYEQERLKDWMTDRRLILNPNESKDEAKPRTIENFDTNLADSLVLITATVSYCPFLVEESFSSIYICPRNFEEVLHNAICVVNAWRKIRLGFVISPLEIVYPNCVKMLMLVVYLYRTLPTYIPRAKIKFSCALTDSTTRQINFINSTGYNVGYLIIVFGDDNTFFTIATSKQIIRVGAHDNIMVDVQFHAKKIKPTKAYLLFCGSTVGPHFGRNQAFVLEGQASTLEIAGEYLINSKLYDVTDTTLTIDVPYDNPNSYEIWMSEERPHKPSSLKMMKWSDLRLRKVPRRLFFNQSSITVEKDSKQAVLSLTVACIMPANRSFWIVFQSKLADFIIQINSHWQPALIDNVVVLLNLEEEAQCICTDERDKACPLDLMVPIPTKNKQLWSCVGYMFQKTLNQYERIFWSRYLDTYIGLRLIRWLMGRHTTDSVVSEFSHIFDRTVTYNVTMSKSPAKLDYPKTFTINDVMTSTTDIPMNIHVSSFPDQLFETTLTLTSNNGKELREYTVSFLRT